MKTKEIRTRSLVTFMLIMIASFLYMRCTKEGPAGPAGPAGPQGPSGPQGPQGPAGKDATLVSAADSAAYDAADGVAGARLYDHVLNAIEVDDTVLTNHPNFWRCKSCHGWDLLGKNGVLIDKLPSDSYPAAADVNLYKWAHEHNIREVFDAITNPGGRSKDLNGGYNNTMPNYGTLLTVDDIWDLVKFLKETAHNVNEFYDLTTSGAYPTGTKEFSDIGKGGDPVNGKVVYDAQCAGCHGMDGTKINVYCKGIYLGDMFREDPHEIQHKSVWGMPIDREHIDSGCADAGMMPPIDITDQDIRDMMVMGQDKTAFPGYGDVNP